MKREKGRQTNTQKHKGTSRGKETSRQTHTRMLTQTYKVHSVSIIHNGQHVSPILCLLGTLATETFKVRLPFHI